MHYNSHTLMPTHLLVSLVKDPTHHTTHLPINLKSLNSVPNAELTLRHSHPSLQTFHTSSYIMQHPPPLTHTHLKIILLHGYAIIE
jgi:hypothetical protein